jgi:hypothetical protein
VVLPCTDVTFIIPLKILYITIQLLCKGLAISHLQKVVGDAASLANRFQTFWRNMVPNWHSIISYKNGVLNHTAMNTSTFVPYDTRHTKGGKKRGICDETLGSKKQGIFDGLSNYHTQWTVDTFIMANLEKVLTVLKSQFWDQQNWSGVVRSANHSLYRNPKIANLNWYSHNHHFLLETEHSFQMTWMI